jgi:hypothetical protein
MTTFQGNPVFVAVFYLVAVYGVGRLLLGLFLPPVYAGYAVLATMATAFLYALCFLSGLLFNVFYEPHSYWTSITLNDAFFNTYVDSLHEEHFYRVFAIPLYAVLQFALWSLTILRTHFTWGFAITYGVGAFILFNWARIAYFNRKLADPTYRL